MDDREGESGRSCERAAEGKYRPHMTSITGISSSCAIFGGSQAAAARIFLGSSLSAMLPVQSRPWPQLQPCLLPHNQKQSAHYAKQLCLLTGPADTVPHK